MTPIRLRLDGPGTAEWFVAQFTETRFIVHSVYRRLRLHLTADDARDAVVRLAIALGTVA